MVDCSCTAAAAAAAASRAQSLTQSSIADHRHSYFPILVAHSDEFGGVPAVPDVGREFCREYRGARRHGGHGAAPRPLLYLRQNSIGQIEYNRSRTCIVSYYTFTQHVS